MLGNRTEVHIHFQEEESDGTSNNHHHQQQYLGTLSTPNPRNPGIIPETHTVPPAVSRYTNFVQFLIDGFLHPCPMVLHLKPHFQDGFCRYVHLPLTGRIEGSIASNFLMEEISHPIAHQKTTEWMHKQMKLPWSWSWWTNKFDPETFDEEPENHPEWFTPHELTYAGCKGLLLMEALHRTPGLWIKLEGRWVVSNDFSLPRKSFSRVAFLIDIKESKIHLAYQLNNNGKWENGQIFPNHATLLRNCLPHINQSAQSLKDDCLFLLLKHLATSGKGLNQLGIPPLDKARLRKIHTLLCRFPHQFPKLQTWF